jgi:hypothetical protein
LLLFKVKLEFNALLLVAVVKLSQIDRFAPGNEAPKSSSCLHTFGI